MASARVGTTGGVEQGVQHKACLLIQPQVLDHILSALLRAQPPILVGGQLAAVVQILKVQAVLDDHAAGGHTDVGAVDVVEDDRLKILVNDLLALFERRVQRSRRPWPLPTGRRWYTVSA